MMKTRARILSILAAACFGTTAFGQSITITDPDYGPSNPVNCMDYNDGSTPNFFDNGGSGNYTANANDDIVICPNLPNGPKITAAFGINAGYTFDIHPSDTLYVYDGPNTSAPLMGAHNSGTDPNGFTHTATFENNPSGCLTFVFHSNATSEGTGWGANITCGNPAQPFVPHIEAFINGQGPNAMNPLDTGYVDICFEDSVLLVAKPVFPYSLENNGIGYSQNVDNVDYSWEFSNGTVGANNDSIWFKPPQRNGYFVSLIITDQFPQLEQIACKIRVSKIPSFAGTGPLDDVLCIYDQTELVGGATPTDTVGVTFPEGSFEIGGTVAGLTALPDGAGQQYSTTITMDDFEPGATFSGPQDLQSICMTMEHSYLGDLEVWLTCPNGTEVTLINSYNPGHISGGFGGGGTFLGDANDNGNGTPGIGWEYCFSSVNSTWGNMAQEFAAGNTVPTSTFSVGNSMNPDGVYQPEENFSAFAGCPLNGDWTITVRDNLSIDDGYIFEWGLYFNPALFPNNESYFNSISDEYWSNDPTIISGMNDTAIVVLPGPPGIYSYTYNVEDNFGCFYDTVVTVTVKQPIVLNMEDTICHLSMTTTLNTGTNDGQWTYYNSTGAPTFQADNVNTTITFPDYGFYHLVYTDTSCTNADTVSVLVSSPPPFNFNSDFFTCSPFDSEHMVFADSALIAEFHWGLVDPSKDTLFTANIYQGTYTASFTTLLGCTMDTTYTITSKPENTLGVYGLICNDTLVMTQNVGGGGVWTSPGGGAVTFASDDINTTVSTTEYGTYVLQYSDTVCTEVDQVTVEFNTSPAISLTGGLTCIGETFVLAAENSSPGSNTSYLWNTGATGSTLDVTTEGVYSVDATNSCGTSTASALVQIILCNIEVPNVFTPNGDGSNDTFQLIEVGGLLDFECFILNRWGNVIREYSDPNFKWDGKDKHGNEVSEGVYFYKITAKTIAGTPIEKQGMVQVIRED